MCQTHTWGTSSSCFLTQTHFRSCHGLFFSSASPVSGPDIRPSTRCPFCACANTTETRSVFRLRFRFPLFIRIIIKLSILIRPIQRRTEIIMKSSIKINLCIDFLGYDCFFYLNGGFKTRPTWLFVDTTDHTLTQNQPLVIKYRLVEGYNVTLCNLPIFEWVRKEESKLILQRGEVIQVRFWFIITYFLLRHYLRKRKASQDVIFTSRYPPPPPPRNKRPRRYVGRGP